MCLGGYGTQRLMGKESLWGLEDTKMCVVAFIFNIRSSPWSKLFPEPHLGSFAEVITSFQEKHKSGQIFMHCR